MANYKQSAATVQVKVGGGRLKGICVSSTSSGTLTVYDSAQSNASDPKIADTITVSAGETYLAITDGIWFNSGLYIVLANTAAFTVLYE